MFDNCSATVDNSDPTSMPGVELIERVLADLLGVDPAHRDALREPTLQLLQLFASLQTPPSRRARGDYRFQLCTKLWPVIEPFYVGHAPSIPLVIKVRYLVVALVMESGVPKIAMVVYNGSRR